MRPLEHEHASLRSRTVSEFAIRDALVQTDGNKQKAAELLGIGRATLWRKLKEMN
jgi:transcriptional regulator of acetoin/glycerol metabolism